MHDDLWQGSGRSGTSPGYAPPVTEQLPATVELLPCSGTEIT